MNAAGSEATSLHEISLHMANLRAHWLAWGGSDSIHEDLIVYRSGLQHGLLNGVLRLSGRSVPEAAPEAEQQLADLPWRWWVGPDSDAGVAGALLERGYSRIGSMPVMAVRLDQMSEPPPPVGLVIECVDGPDGVRDYVVAYASSFGVGATLQNLVVDAESSLRTDLGRLIRVVGRIDGRAVATSAVLISRGVAGIYWVGTDPTYRRRGIGAALTAAAMAIGRQHGALVCTLQASDMGAPVYRRLGFTPVSEVVLYSPPLRP
ncbi:GNAT family N-acetyltransferase [Kitasatospora paranensis]|uniref:GNAT family N-acetyltransferase n=1 Tax=Kitasatospora paranensis TaxID=258053 RepID=A0ABW2FY33_9ACTN